MTRSHSCSFISESSERVDKAASAFMPRSAFSRDDTVITVNGRNVKKSYRLAAGDEVSVSYTEECFESLEAEDIPLDIIYEDDSLLVINKRSGLVVHPGAGNWSGTLVNALLYRYGEEFATAADEDDNLIRPGIVHRLDKDTSGVLVVAKTAEAHQKLALQFASHTNEKIYVALVKGSFSAMTGTVDKALCRSARDRKLFETTDIPEKGKSAVTHYKVLWQNERYSFLRIRIETGRTHQIRVHMKSIGHPVLGDELYSSCSKYYSAPLALHAYSLTIDHPVTGGRMTFSAPVPERISSLVPAEAVQEV